MAVSRRRAAKVQLCAHGDEAAVGKAAHGGKQVALADGQGSAEHLGRLRARRWVEALDDAHLGRRVVPEFRSL